MSRRTASPTARLAGLLGVGSAALLGAAVRWAHHWGVVADSLVAAWAFTTIGALTMSVWSLRTSAAGRRLAKLAVSLAGASLLALCLAGLLYAAGINAAGACGGG